MRLDVRKNSLSHHLDLFLQIKKPQNSPPPGSIVSREALAAAAAAAAEAWTPSTGRVPRRSALRISAAEPHGGGGGGGAAGGVGAGGGGKGAAAPRITQLTRLTLATGDPGEAAAVLGNRIGKAGGGGAGVLARCGGGSNAPAAPSTSSADASAPSPSRSVVPPSARRSYDILAIRPLNSRVLAQAATSLDVDIIVLDFTGSASGASGSRGGSKRPTTLPSPPASSSFSLARMPKPAALRPALARGISLEIRYAPALSSEVERRAFLAGLGSLSTTLRGKGGGGSGAECLCPFLLSSGATSSSSLRAPLDAAALAEVGGLSRAAALAAVTRVPGQVATRARKRRAASRGECGFVGGREGMNEIAGIEAERDQRRKSRKRKGGGAGGGGGMQFNQQARQPKQLSGGGGGRKKKKR